MSLVGGGSNLGVHVCVGVQSGKIMRNGWR